MTSHDKLRRWWGIFVSVPAILALSLGAQRLEASVLAVPTDKSSERTAAFRSIPPAQSGIHWVHDNARSELRYLPETMGPGVAFLDYDGDGLMDIYLVNSGRSDFYDPPESVANALYRNNGDGSFTDVAEKAGVRGGTFGMGVAVGDYDDDGDPDIFVTSYGRCILYRNDGDGTFTDVTDTAGVAAAGWTTSAVWFDFDGDGHLDLFVCSFVEFGVNKHIHCGDNKLGRSFYCIPRVFNPTPSLLFRNKGDGTFVEVSQGTDIATSLGKALGVVATDINNDRRMDLFVANDTVQNFLFANRGDGRFEEIGLPAEVGFSANGKARSGMGVDAADFDSDGWQDLFVSNVDQEMYSLYRNNKEEWFRDEAHANEVAKTTRFMSGWGLKFIDYDSDGDWDLLLVNGHPDDQIDEYGSSQVTYREKPLLFEGENGRFRNVSLESGEVFSTMYSSRGLAVGDYDNDGRPDAVIGNNGEPPVLLHNESQNGHHWVGLRLAGSTANRDAVGAIVKWSVGGRESSRLKTNGGSYLSSHDPRVLIGLGDATSLDWLEVQWPPPSVTVDRLVKVPVDRYIRVIEGQGIAE